MAINSKNKYPADKAGTKYSEFKNTKRVSPGKAHKDVKQTGAGADQASGKTA
jgi:hypothetical protein